MRKNSMRLRRLSLAALVLFAFLLRPDDGRNAALAQNYGTITGKFVLKGDVPKPQFVIMKGRLVSDGTVPKDPAVCAAKDLKSDALVVDPKGKGIGNVFVYLLRSPKDVHPDLKAVPRKALVFDQIGCRYVPHAMFVRAGQTVNARSSDNAAHNVHTYPLRNEAENFIIPANFKKDLPMKKLESSEFLPIKVGCDIHTWMSAYWLVLDHPYGAVTVATAPKKKGEPEIGTFKIEKLPYGDYEFRVWHEGPGYVNVGTKRGFKITVDKPEIKKEFTIPAEKLNSR
jgi:hypothetical protein